MDHSFIRGAAAALLAIAAAPRVHAQVAAGAIQVRPGRDTFTVRVLREVDRVKLDSIMVMMRAFEAEPMSSEAGMRMRREMELMFRALSAAGRGPGGGGFFRPGDELRQVRLKGWIGVNIGLVPMEQRIVDTSGYFVRYFQYPPIVSVEPDSPAQRAGLVKGDTLVAYDGQDVVRGRVNMRELLVPEKKLDVTVRRDGETRDFTVVVAKTPERIAFRWSSQMPVPAYVMEGRGPYGRGVPAVAVPAEPPRRGPSRQSATIVAVSPSSYAYNRFVFMNRDGVFGAGLMTVGSELAKFLKLETGVLVQEAADETPAFKAGLRLGDVIVSVAGQPVNTVAEVQSVVMSRLAEKAVSLQVVREKKPVTVNVKW